MKNTIILFALLLYGLLISISYADNASQKNNEKVFSQKKIKKKKTAKKQETKLVVPPKVQRDSYLHPAALSESWVFSGIVDSESGKQYGYYFAVVRTKDNFDAFAKVNDIKTGNILFSEKKQKEISLVNKQGINFKLDDAFLHYNEISDSWMFGVDKDNGFNLRVEASKENAGKVTHLSNVSFYSLQSMRLNGHITLDDKSEFVTAKNAWLNHQWQTASLQPVTILRASCRFTDSRGLLIERISQQKKMLYESAFLLDSRGNEQPVSQFSSVKHQAKDQWHLHVVAPSLDINVLTPLPQKAISEEGTTEFFSGIARLLKKNEKAPLGYCLMTSSKMQLKKKKPEEKSAEEAVKPSIEEKPQEKTSIQ